MKPYQLNDLRSKVAECLKLDQIFMKSKAEVMAQYRLNEDNYIEIKDAFLRVLDEYIAFLKRNNAGKDLDHENIHECSVLFGTEQLRLLLEKAEARKNAGHVTIDDPEINQALINEIKRVSKALSQ